MAKSKSEPVLFTTTLNCRVKLNNNVTRQLNPSLMSPVNSILLSACRREIVSPSSLGPRSSTLYLHSCPRSEEREEGGAENSPHATPSIWYASPAYIACHSISGRKQGQIKSGCQDTRFAASRDVLYSLCESSDWKDKNNLISHSALLLW